MDRSVIGRSDSKRVVTWKWFAVAVVVLGVGAALAVPSMTKRRGFYGDTNAAMSLNTLKNVQASWRESDFDGNGVKDFWTLDIAGFYGVLDGNGEPIKQIQIGLAKADGAPGQEYVDVPTTGVARSGYIFRMIPLDVDGKPYCQDEDDDGKAHTNRNLFGICCYPGNYGTSGRRTYILNEEGQVYGIDNGGKPVGRWPADDPTTAGWSKEGT